MRKGFPVSRTTLISGLNGTGKSFMMANAIKNAQEKGYFAVLLDTENSLGEGFMEKIGVDLDEDKFMAVSIYSIQDTMAFLSDLFANTTKEDKVFIGIDSLSNLEPEGDMNKNADGKVAYSQGLNQKLYKQLVRYVNTQIGQRNAICVMNAHEYVAGQDAMSNPIYKPAVGEGTQYLPSVSLSIKKSDLREGSVSKGIIVRFQAIKTRFTKVKQKCQFDLPWDEGMDPLDGSIDFFEEMEIIKRAGAWYSYTNQDTGEIIKFQSKNLKDHIDYLFTLYASHTGGPEEKEDDEANVEMISTEE
jgi:recombination protein RecA